MTNKTNDAGKKNHNGINRRSFLRRASTSGAIVGLGLPSASSPAAATECGFGSGEGYYEEKGYEWKKQDSVNEKNSPSGSGSDYAIETRTSVVYSESYYGNDERWNHFFYEGSHITTQKKRTYESPSAYSPDENIATHKLTLHNTADHIASLFTTKNSYDLGASPPPNASTDSGYGDAAFTALYGLMSMGSTTFDVATTAAEIVNDLRNNSESDNGNYQEFTWPYSASFPCEAGHYSHFIMKSHEYYSEARVNVYEYSVADAGNVNNSYTWEIKVDPEDNGNIQSTEQERSIASMSHEEYIDYLETSDEFEKIPYDRLDREDLKSIADGGPLYKARNPSIEITGRSGAPDEFAPDPSLDIPEMK